MYTETVGGYDWHPLSYGRQAGHLSRTGEVHDQFRPYDLVVVPRERMVVDLQPESEGASVDPTRETAQQEANRWF